jgi:hypothetical protein
MPRACGTGPRRGGRGDTPRLRFPLLTRAGRDTTYAMLCNCRLLPLIACLLEALTGCAPAVGGMDLKLTAGSEPFWGIRCDSRRGPERFKITQQEVDALKKVRGLKPELVQLVNNEDESVVYYGRYRRSVAVGGKTPTYRPDALRDLELIRSLSLNVDGQPAWPFIYATLEELPSGRPQHPEWNLANAKGYWTLHVAVFYNEGEITSRKYLAEEYCRELREQKVEAYYHHGPVRSSVYVGLFPKQAVQPFKETNPLSGVVTVTNKVVDERLIELQKRFPVSYQNGKRVNELVTDPKTGQVSRLPFQSFIVKVPSAEAAESGRRDGH